MPYEQARWRSLCPGGYYRLQTFRHPSEHAELNMVRSAPARAGAQGLRRLHDFRHREMHIGEHVIRRAPALGNVAHGQHAHARPIARSGGRFGDFAAERALRSDPWLWCMRVAASHPALHYLRGLSPA